MTQVTHVLERDAAVSSEEGHQEQSTFEQGKEGVTRGQGKERGRRRPT